MTAALFEEDEFGKSFVVNRNEDAVENWGRNSGPERLEEEGNGTLWIMSMHRMWENPENNSCFVCYQHCFSLLSSF